MIYCHSLDDRALVFIESHGNWLQPLDVDEFFSSIHDNCWKWLIQELCPVLQYCFAEYKITTAREREDERRELDRVDYCDRRQLSEITRKKAQYIDFTREGCLQDIEEKNCQLDELNKKLSNVKIELLNSQSVLLNRVLALGTILVPALDMCGKTRKNVFMYVNYRIENYFSYFRIGEVLPDKYINAYKSDGTFDERFMLGVYFLKGCNVMTWSVSDHVVERESVELRAQQRSCESSIKRLYANLAEYDDFIANPPKFVPTTPKPILQDKLIIQHYLDGKSYTTIAKLLDIDTTIVNSRLTRCRKTLKYWRNRKCFLGDLDRLLTKRTKRC
jgi:hypothetical protein